MKYICLFLLLTINLLANENTLQPKTYSPWYTGPLLAASAYTLPPGSVYTQPYLYLTNTYGSYTDSFKSRSQPSVYSVTPDISFQTGLTNFFDIAVEGSSIYNNRKGKTAYHLEDITVKLGMQLLREKKETFYPTIKFRIQEYFPTGKYKNLNPEKFGIDATGTGDYRTIFLLAMSKIFYFWPMHPNKWTFNLAYQLPTKVKVKDFNSYGGGYGTNGTVTPGQTISTDIAVEYSCSQSLVLVMEAAYSYTTPTKYSGTIGYALDGSLSSNSSNSSMQCSLAPAIEYNFTQNVGFIGGVWFSIFGKNSSQFVSAVISLCYTF